MRGRLPELDRLMVKSQGSLLAVWPDYWRLKLLIGIPETQAKAMQAHVQAFLARHPDHPLRETVQREWIGSLISKGLWDDARSALRQLPDTLVSPQITCAKARLGLLPADLPGLETGFSSLAVGNEAGEPCLGLVEELAKNEAVSVGYLRQRVRWAAQIGSDSAFSKAFDIYRTYAKAQQLDTRGPDHMKSESALGQILKTGRTDNLAALKAYQRHQADLSPEQRAYAAFSVGAVLWRRSHPQTWELMREGWSSLTQQPDEMLQTAARESIRRGEWGALLELISAMRASTQKDSAWQYWQAIALLEQKKNSDARAIFKSLAHEFSFYGLLAKEQLGETVKVPASPAVTLSDTDRQKLGQELGIQRSYALLRLGLRAEAIIEWSGAMRHRNDTDLIKAALHAREHNFFDRMIAAADRTQQSHDFTLRYPAPFKDTVVPAAKQRAVDPFWVLGLIRQESRFIPDVRSPVGATGLMQIMPATGKMLAKSTGLRSPNKLQLTDIETNVQLGIHYMRQLHDRFDGSALLASAAYNAGPSRASLWRSNLPQRTEGAAFAESIPFPETRDYVKRVLANAVLYHAVHNGGSAPSLRKLLGEVTPRSPL